MVKQEMKEAMRQSLRLALSFAAETADMLRPCYAQRGYRSLESFPLALSRLLHATLIFTVPRWHVSKCKHMHIRVNLQNLSSSQ